MIKNTKDHCGYILVSFYKGFELFYLFKVNCMIVFSLDFCLYVCVIMSLFSISQFLNLKHIMTLCFSLFLFFPDKLDHNKLSDIQ
jgi:hypothetical protein